VDTGLSKRALLHAVSYTSLEVILSIEPTPEDIVYNKNISGKGKATLP
jgi:hypothetical protein